MSKMDFPTIPSELLITKKTIGIGRDQMSTETTWVPQTDYETVLTAATDMRRTLALLHMRLSLEGASDDLLLWLRSQTGYTLADATAMRSVVEEFKPVPLGES